MANKKSTRLGQILLEKGLITKEQLGIAVHLQEKRRKDENLHKGLATSLGEILIEQGFIDRLQLNRGLNWQMLLRKMTLVMSFCAPMMVSFSPVAAAASSSSSSSSSSSVVTKNYSAPIRIEAESYSKMSGVDKQTTSDVGGGQNVGWLDTNDWMSYENVTINALVAGNYKIIYRVAGLGGGIFTLKDTVTNAVYDTVNVDNTGGFQTWKNIEHVVSLPAGPHSFLISVVARGNGFNLNWLDVQRLGASLPLTIQAEDYSTMSGIQTQPTTDVGGGQNVGWIDSKDWMDYSNFPIYISTTGSYKVTYRVSGMGGGSFALKESDGSITYDTVPVNNTGGWQTWVNQERVITLTKGTHSFLLSVLDRGAGFNLNWFKIEYIASNASSSLPSISSASPSSAKNSSSIGSSKSSSSASSVVSSTSSVANISISSPLQQTLSTVAGPVAFMWLIPNQRENGTILDITELGGYELRYRKDTDTAFTYITIADPWKNSYNFNWLEGKYIFQISAFDKNGLYSNFVDLQPH